MQAPVSTRKYFPDTSSRMEKVADGKAAAAPDCVHSHLDVVLLEAALLEINAEDERVWLKILAGILSPSSGMSLLRDTLKNSLMKVNKLSLSELLCTLI